MKSNMRHHRAYEIRLCPLLRGARLRPACQRKVILDKAAADFFQVLERYSVADLEISPPGCELFWDSEP